MATEKRLIDANVMRQDWLENGENEYVYDANAVLDSIDAQPTVDAVEVVHGRWEWYTDRCEDLFLGCDDDYGWRCSCCETPLEDCDDPEMPPTLNYCPNCGAKMDGGNEDV